VADDPLVSSSIAMENHPFIGDFTVIFLLTSLKPLGASMILTGMGFVELFDRLTTQTS